MKIPTRGRHRAEGDPDQQTGPITSNPKHRAVEDPAPASPPVPASSHIANRAVQAELQKHTLKGYQR